MYILLISRGYPSVNDPQWGSFERDQAEALQKLGHKVVIASVDKRFRLKYRKIGVTHFVKNNVYIYNSFVIPSVFFSIFSKKLNFKFIQFQLKNLYEHIERDHGKPNIIYSHYLPNTAASVALKFSTGIPLVGIEHWSQVNVDNLSPYIEYMGNIAYSNTDYNIAVSLSLSKRIKHHFNRESLVVNNMANESYFFDTISKRKEDNRFNFITVGSLLQIKNHSLLINAFNKANMGKNITLTIVGGGKLRKTLQRQIEDLNLQDNVFLLGKKNKEEIKSILSNSNAFVLSSNAETFGVVIVEALSSGLPCISTACGGPNEIITENNGLLVPVKDVDKLSKALIVLKENYNKYDRQAIAEDCKVKYHPEVIAKQLESIFEKVVNKNSKQAL